MAIANPQNYMTVTNSELNAVGIAASITIGFSLPQDAVFQTIVRHKSPRILHSH